MTFDGPALKRHRVLAGKSRSDLAAASGLSEEAVRLIEMGRVTPRPSSAVALADALGVDVADLWIDEARAVAS